MIIGDSKKVASQVLAHMRPMEMPKAPEPKPEEEMDEDKEGLKAIAEEMISAMHSKDAAELARAMCDFLEMYKPESDEEESESPDEAAGVDPSLGVKLS